MVPRVAQRGHSFMGAGRYYLHDKQSATSERVEWTLTHNLPTDNPDKAFRYMASTAKKADYLKHQSGMAKTGRKRSAGSVYSFSLAWHPEQEPERAEMETRTLNILEELGLIEHECVMVAHSDTEHPHVHAIVNLVHPETGRTAVPSYDYITHSRVAEDVEREEGQIRCAQRVINNEKRRALAKNGRQLGLVKHQEKKLEQAQVIQDLYSRSDSAQTFQAALQDTGLTLAKGDRRGFVLVDERGKIFSLSKQLKGQRAKDIKARLKELEHLPNAQKLADTRQYFYRDDYETQRQKDIVDGAIEAEQERKGKAEQEKQHSLRSEHKQGESQKGPQIEQTSQSQTQKDEPLTHAQSTAQSTAKAYDEHLKRLDAMRVWEHKIDQARARLEADQTAYGRDDLKKRIAKLEQKIEKSQGFVGRITGKHEALKDELETLSKNLNSIDSRIQEQNDTFEKQAEKSKPQFDQDQEDERQKRIHNLKQKFKDQSRDKGKDQGLDRDFGPEI